MGLSDPILKWRTECKDNYTVASFEVASTDRILDHRQLVTVELPAEVRGKEDRGLILTGRGPIWLYSYLTHLAHTFAWVAVYDPRLSGAVVVQRHTKDAPEIGVVIPT